MDNKKFVVERFFFAIKNPNSLSRWTRDDYNLLFTFLWLFFFLCLWPKHRIIFLFVCGFCRAYEYTFAFIFLWIYFGVMKITRAGSWDDDGNRVKLWGILWLWRTMSHFSVDFRWCICPTSTLWQICIFAVKSDKK
jgi:hypothetical protein